MNTKNIKETKNELFTEKAGSKTLDEIIKIVERIQKKLEKVENKHENAPAM